MTPRERQLQKKKAARAGKKTLVDSARNVVRTVNRNVYNTLFKSKTTKGRGVRGKAPSAPRLPQTQETKSAKAKAAALKKKAAAESAASRKRLAAIRAGKNPATPMSSKAAAKPAPKKATPKKAAPKKATAKAKPTVRKPDELGVSAVERQRRLNASSPEAMGSVKKKPAPKPKPQPTAKAKPSAPKSTPKASSMSAQNKEYDRLRKAGKTKEAEALGKKIAAEMKAKAPKNPYRAPQGSERKDRTYKTLQALRARFNKGEQTNPERGRTFNEPTSADKRNSGPRNNSIA